jgi:esterase/lipase
MTDRARVRARLTIAIVLSRGHQVLAIDFSGYGRFTAGADSHALFEDVLAEVRYLHSHGVARVSVLGASMGGGAVAEAAGMCCAGRSQLLPHYRQAPQPESPR